MLNRKELLNLIFVVVLLIGIPFAVSLIRQQQILRSRAAINPVVFTGPNVKSIADSAGVQKLIATAQNVELQLTSTLNQLLPSPTIAPTAASTTAPTTAPTQQPTANPTAASTTAPTTAPTQQPTANPNPPTLASLNITPGNGSTISNTSTISVTATVNNGEKFDIWIDWKCFVGTTTAGQTSSFTIAQVVDSGRPDTSQCTPDTKAAGSHTIHVAPIRGIAPNHVAGQSNGATYNVTIPDSPNPSNVSGSCSGNTAQLSWTGATKNGAAATNYTLRMNKEPFEWAPNETCSSSTPTSGDCTMQVGTGVSTSVKLSTGRYGFSIQAGFSDGSVSSQVNSPEFNCGG